MTIVVALSFGALIGVLLGLLGGGGSILAVPALVYAVGLDMREAIPVSLLVVGLASAVGVIPRIRAGQVQWRLAAVFAAAGIPATFAGTAISTRMPQNALLIGFAAVMVMAGARMLSDTASTGTACDNGDGGIDWRRCTPRSVPAGAAVGLLTGLFGVGGGFLIIPALVIALGVDMTIAVGTSLLIIVVNSAAGLLSHLHGLQIDWAVTAAFAGAATVCSLIAGALATGLDTRRLQRWFAYLVFTVATFVLVDTIWLH
ncbi:MAG: sulfite exporter TauE/SafE family protein [Actinomycetota bacterium]|nr:sulfite exporter TauE/SafE family protein [Actinomycetota bacterium]